MATSKSQEELELDDYLNEIKDIAQGHRHSVDDIDEPIKAPEEGELEAKWLKDVGLEEVAAFYERGQEIDPVILHDLTASFSGKHATAIRKRVDSLNNTTRKRKQRQQAKTDIRNIFPASTPADNNNDVTTASGPPLRQNSSEGGVKRASGQKAKEVSVRRNKQTYSMDVGNILKPRNEFGVEPVRIHRLSVDDQQLSPTDIVPPPTLFADNISPSSSSLEKAAINSKNGHSSSDLPAYVWSHDPVGVTRMDELSPNDRKLVRQFALMELTSLLDQYNIDVGRPPKVKRKGKDHGIFSVPLNTLLEYDQKKYPHVQVPIFVQQLLSYMERTAVEEEGILRVPGSAYRIKSLRDDLDHQFNTGKWTWDDVRPNDAAGLLKQFVRDLPSPLLTWECVESFSKLQSIADEKQRLACLNFLCLQLPDVNSNTLQLLLRFLKKVVDDPHNKMTLYNVAMIMAPNLFVLPVTQNKQPDASEYTLAANTASIMRLMIHYRQLLWTVSGEIMARVRLKTEAESQKKRLMLTRKPKEKKLSNQDVHEDSTTLKVHTQKMTKKEFIEVRVTTTTTAADVVAAVLRSPYPSTAKVPNGRITSSADHLNVANPSILPPMMASGGKLHLYECGGNIGERCLPSDALVLAVFKLNRNADWQIRWKYAFDQL